MQSASRVELYLDPTIGDISLFTQLLQRGILVKTRVGCSVKSLLSEQLGLQREYIEQCIQTIFLDGKPVDSIESAIIKDGATLVLSAAMPGLVGATMRCGGYYAGLRSGISYRQEAVTGASGEGVVVVKLFNLVADDLGPVFLQQGVWVKRAHLEDFVRSRPADFWTKFTAVRLDEREIAGSSLSQLDWSRMDELVRLKVHQGNSR